MSGFVLMQSLDPSCFLYTCEPYVCYICGCLLYFAQLLVILPCINKQFIYKLHSVFSSHFEFSGYFVYLSVELRFLKS